MYQREFDTTERPCTVPPCLFGKGWIDESWHNDTCPSFGNETLKIKVWVDFNNVEDRECDFRSRISVFPVDDDGCADLPGLFFCDDGDELAAFLETLKK